MQQHDVAGGSFDEGPDGGCAVLTDDEVPFPVAGDGTIGGLGGPLADEDHGMGEAWLVAGGLAVWLAAGTAGTQSIGQFTT